jgi:hypothetical protein
MTVEGVVAREWAARSLFGWTDDSFGAYTQKRRLTLTLHDQSSVDLPTLKLVSAALAAVAKATRRSVRAFPPLRPSGLPSEPFWNVLSADRLAQWADVELVCVRTRVGVFVSSRVFFCVVLRHTKCVHFCYRSSKLEQKC